MASIIDAFTTETTIRLTGLTARQLSYWDKTGFFRPSRREEGRYLPYGRIYSFNDLVGLRTIALLRDRVSLQELRKVGAWLSQHVEDPWSSLRFFTRGKQVYFRDPDTHDLVSASAPRGHKTIVWEMEAIANDLTKRLTTRSENQIGTLDQRRTVLNNAVVIAGTRIPTSTIWELTQLGYSEDRILEDYPRLTSADVRAALEYEVAQHATRAS